MVGVRPRAPTKGTRSSTQFVIESDCRVRYIGSMDIFEKESSQTDILSQSTAPLADRMRPQTIDQFVGQSRIFGIGTPLRQAIERDQVGSMILWGPPGSGKTTLARLIASTTRGQFVPFSAVTSGIKEVKAVISKAGNYFKLTGRRTYIFIDEIHRFNKAQQDAFLPYVESGDIVLIGATTENPSFEVNSALLSRMRVNVLERLSPVDIRTLLEGALSDEERGLGGSVQIEENGLDFVAAAADGDARRGLSLLEAAATFVDTGKTITVDDLKQVHQRGLALYDKGGEEHYNLISALHKTIRGGDPDASLYWLARMIEAGEEPMYIIRRLVRFATEDIGLADPYALTLTLNARDAFHFLGPPEGELAIAQAVIYMACAPKSNSVYTAFKAARVDAAEKGSLPVPLGLRNAPTSLMKEIGYGQGYQYAHEYKDGVTGQEYFPEELAGTSYYKPSAVGREQRLADYLEQYKQFRRQFKEGS